jgi:hypothetical protein
MTITGDYLASLHMDQLEQLDILNIFSTGLTSLVSPRLYLGILNNPLS